MIGVWTGCGFSTIGVVFPPREILGYDACVPPVIQGTDELGVLDFQGPPVPTDDSIPIVIVE
jgi:hypothetical protein